MVQDFLNQQYPKVSKKLYGIDLGQAIQETSNKDPHPRDPRIQAIPTLGPKASKYYLHWAVGIHRDILGP